MEIGANVHMHLVTLISEHVPVAEEPGGRDMLLNGIFNQKGWSRHPNNKRTDVYHIINYLKNYFIEDMNEIEAWGLIIFIDNALREVAGTATATQLRDLRQQCIARWEKEQIEQNRLMPHSDTKHKEQTPSSPSQPEQIQMPTPLSSSKHFSSEEDTHPLEYASFNFFETITCLMQIILESIELAEKPFQPSFKASDLVKRRIALKHLEDVVQPLHQMGDYLENISPLPEVIVEKRHILKNQIYHLIEQIQALRSWIDTSSGACQSILERFEEIKRIFMRLYALKGDDSAHQQTT